MKVFQSIKPNQVAFFLPKPNQKNKTLKKKKRTNYRIQRPVTGSEAPFSAACCDSLWYDFLTEEAFVLFFFENFEGWIETRQFWPCGCILPVCALTMWCNWDSFKEEIRHFINKNSELGHNKTLHLYFMNLHLFILYFTNFLRPVWKFPNVSMNIWPMANWQQSKL